MPGVGFGRLLAALAIVAATVTVPVDGASPQESDRREPLTLVDQTTWVRADQRFSVRVRIDSRRPDRNLQLALTVFGRVPFRSHFAQTIDGRLLGSVLAHETVPVAEPSSEPSAEPAAGDLAETLRSPDGSLTATIVPPLRQPGVYPVRIELRDSREEDPLARLTTHLIHLPDDEYPAPLHVAPLIRIDASPAIGTNGDTSVPLARTRELTAIAEALQARPGLAATVVPTADTLDSLAVGPSGGPEQAALEAVRRAVSDRDLLASTYAPADLAALLDAGLEREAEIQLERARGTIERLLDRKATPDVWVSDAALDTTAVEWLRDRGYHRFILGEDSVEPVGLSTTLTAPFELALPDDDHPLAAAIDDGLAAHFDASEQPVIAAHRLLADLAVLYFDHPGREGRGVAVTPPRDWRPDEAFLEALFDGLAGSPILATTTIGDLLDTVPPATSGGETLVRRMQERSGGRGLPAGSIASARSRLDSFATLLEADNVRHLEFERLLLVAEDTSLRATRRDAYLQGFHQAIDAELALVEVPERQAIRLTAREGAIPIPILSRTGYPLRVLVRVEGDTVDFPLGGDRLVSLTNETTTERIPVRARSSGAFPLRVTVLSPDGDLAIGASRLTVTSTAASWVGLALSAGAALFLAVWWARHIHGRRSGKLIPT